MVWSTQFSVTDGRLRFRQFFFCILDGINRFLLLDISSLITSQFRALVWRTTFIKLPTRTWNYECNFITYWQPTCFDHSCGHLQCGDIWTHYNNVLLFFFSHRRSKTYLCETKLHAYVSFPKYTIDVLLTYELTCLSVIEDMTLMISGVPRNFFRGGFNKFSWGQRTERGPGVR